MLESEENPKNDLHDEEILTTRFNIENTEKKNQRKLYINTFNDNNFEQTEKFCNNKIRTSKYTLLTFLPLALFY